jgi:hypothetical protein
MLEFLRMRNVLLSVRHSSFFVKSFPQANQRMWKFAVREYLNISGAKNVHIFDIEDPALVSFSTLSNFSCLNTALWLFINRNSERVSL